MELKAGRRKGKGKGNTAGPAHVYNVKSQSDQEMALAWQAKQAYEPFVASGRSIHGTTGPVGSRNSDHNDAPSVTTFRASYTTSRDTIAAFTGEHRGHDA